MKLVKGAETLGGAGRFVTSVFLKSVIAIHTAAFCWQLLSFSIFIKLYVDDGGMFAAFSAQAMAASMFQKQVTHFYATPP